MTGTTAPTRPASGLARTATIVLLGLVAVGSARKYREGFDPGNEAGRVHAAMAIVDHGSVHLEDVWDEVAPGWRAAPDPPNGDAARKDGHYLLDKPPGITLLMVPVIALLRATGVDPGFTDLLGLLTLLIAALPCALFIPALGRFIRVNLGEGRAAALVAPAVVLATPWLLFASQVVGHAPAACLCGLGVMLALGRLRPGGAEKKPARSAFLGGLALGGAVLVESSSALVVLSALLALLLDPGRRRRLTFVVQGGLGPALLFLAWNQLCFGSPFTYGYAWKLTPSMAAAHGRGILGLSWPAVDGLFGLLFFAKRGLFFLSPWLLLAPVGAVLACFDRHVARAWKVLLVLGTLLVPTLMSGFSDWHGGQTLGPRYLIFILPVFGLAAALAADRLERGRLGPFVLPVFGGLLVSSLVVLLLANAGIPAVVHVIENPIAEVVLPVLLKAGPLGTVWDPVVGALAGTALAVAAAIALLVLMAAWGGGPGFPRRPGPGRRAAAALLLCAAALHFAVIPVAHTKEPPREAWILRARWFSYHYMGRADLRAQEEPGIRRIEPPGYAYPRSGPR